MTPVFNKKFTELVPKRSPLHKLHIFLTFIWTLSFFSSLLAHHSFSAIMDFLCILGWGLNWFISAKKYDFLVKEYNKKLTSFNTELIEFNNKNKEPLKFDFNYINN